MLALLGPLGAVFLFVAYLNRDDSVARFWSFGIAGLVCFAVMIASTPKTGGRGVDCFVDWDARSNSTVCD